MIDVHNHILSEVFWFHYHSQKVIGSLGMKTNHLSPKKTNPSVWRLHLFPPPRIPVITSSQCIWRHFEVDGSFTEKLHNRTDQLHGIMKLQNLKRIFIHPTNRFSLSNGRLGILDYGIQFNGYLQSPLNWIVHNPLYNPHLTGCLQYW